MRTQNSILVQCKRVAFYRVSLLVLGLQLQIVMPGDTLLPRLFVCLLSYYAQSAPSLLPYRVLWAYPTPHRETMQQQFSFIPPNSFDFLAVDWLPQPSLLRDPRVSSFWTHGTFISVPYLYERNNNNIFADFYGKAVPIR